MFNEEDVLETPAEVLAPAYSVLGSADDGNMSCSRRAGDFCFLCSYSGSDSDQLREYVDTLVDSGRELGAIASAVHKVRSHSLQNIR